MAYKFKYNERPRSYSEEKHGDEDMLLCGETTEKADSTIALPA